MSRDLEQVERKFRHAIPKEHQYSLDTRLAWLWNQRSGTVQSVRENSPDVLDHTAASMVLQALFSRDLNSIALLLRRLEGGAVTDEQVEESDGLHF